MKSIVRYGRGSARTLPAHRDRGLEIIFLEKGALNWHVEGKVEHVTAGSVYFSLPWQEHGSADEFEPGHYWHWAQLGLLGSIGKARRTFEFHPDLGLGRKVALEISALLTRSGRHCYPATPRMAWIVPALVDELHASEGQDRKYVSALARLAVLELARCIRRSANQAEESSRSEQVVAKFIKTLGAHCDEAWKLERMAAACGLGRSRFAALCKQLSGDSPLTLVNRLRVDRAKILLRASTETVTQIAFACGFSSSQYFARVFKEFTGLDARSYRRRHSEISPAAR